MMELQVRELRAVSRCDALLVLRSWSNVVRVICATTCIVAIRVMRAQMGHFAATDWVI